jgi:hypothetical protein
VVELVEFRCQDCGFRVFNRLYPFCESCKAVLAPGIALSAAERSAHFEQVRIDDERKLQERLKRDGLTRNDPGGGDFWIAGSYEADGDSGS